MTHSHRVVDPLGPESSMQAAGEQTALCLFILGLIQREPTVCTAYPCWLGTWRLFSQALGYTSSQTGTHCLSSDTCGSPMPVGGCFPSWGHFGLSLDWGVYLAMCGHFLYGEDLSCLQGHQVEKVCQVVDTGLIRAQSTEGKLYRHYPFNLRGQRHQHSTPACSWDSLCPL